MTILAHWIPLLISLFLINHNPSQSYTVPSITKDLFRFKQQWQQQQPRTTNNNNNNNPIKQQYNKKQHKSNSISLNHGGEQPPPPLSNSNIPVIDQWKIIKSGAIIGKIQNHPTIADGDTITTSSLEDPTAVMEGAVVVTVNGSEYKLLGKASQISFPWSMTKPPSSSNSATNDRPIKGLPQLDEWRILKSGSIVGVIRNHPTISDGDTITTSAIADGSDITDGMVVMTVSGSKYQLLTQSEKSSTMRAKEQQAKKTPNGLAGLPLSISLSLPSMTNDLAALTSWTNGIGQGPRNKGKEPVNLPVIDEWRIKKSGAVVGVVQNHPTIRDGDTITTSTLTDPKAVAEGSIVVTISGSRYKLLKESGVPNSKGNPNPDNNNKRSPANGINIPLSIGFPKLSVEQEEEKEDGDEQESTLNIPEIDQWRITSTGAIAGIAQNHASIEDGDTMTTSTLADLNAVKEGAIVMTKSGSKYKLLKQSAISAKMKHKKKPHNDAAAGSIKKSIQSGVIPNGLSIANGKYLLAGEPRRTASGRSQIWTAYKVNPSNGHPTGDCLAVKMTSDFNRLSRENLNYEKITTGFFPGQFVKKREFLPDANGKGFETQSALVIESGVKDLKELLNERWGQGLEKKAMRDAAVRAGQCIQAMHSSRMVWTDLKSENFVLMTDVDGDDGLNDLKGIDLESAMPFGRNPVDYSPEACPPEFARSFVAGDVADFVLDPSYDMWSLGMMLYEVSTGQPYFKGSSPVVITKELSSADFEVDVSNVRDDKLRDLISQCLNVDPKKRPSITQYFLHSYFTTSGFGSFSF